MADARNPPTRHDRDSVVDAALRLLDEYGLADLTMRRLAGALDVQPSALYWHFESKQALLAAVADRILAGARDAAPADADWRSATHLEATAIRDALLAYRDGAEVVMSTRALGLGGDAALERLVAALRRGHRDAVAELAATALLHLVLGDASLVQQRIQADSLGVVAARGTAPVVEGSDGVFRAGVDLLLTGLEHSALRSE